MFLQYGNYRHAAGECAVVIARRAQMVDGMTKSVVERWDVQGRLQAADAASLSTAIAALENAYATPGLDLGFYFDNGAASSHRLTSAAANGGTRVVRPPDFPIGTGAEYSTFRTYALAVEAEYLNLTLDLASWHEALNFRGGGPQFGFLEPINGLPQKQLLKQATTFKAVQQGTAVGMFSYPIPPPPIWPEAEHLDQRGISYDLPRRSGHGASATYSEYRVSWSYSFEAEVPLFGLPTAP